MRFLRVAAMVAALFVGGQAAWAEDPEPCGADQVCASNPQSVVEAMEKAGYDVKLGTDNVGDPMIDSRAAYPFTIYFYGCEAHRNCDSLRFEVLFEKAPENTDALANKWNAGKRFLQMSVKPAGTLAAAYDVATIGGLNRRNFGDVLDWWSSMLEEMGKFFQAEVVEGAGSEQAAPAQPPEK